ncbi:MAG: cob(I)yrinic acid a,c-diamide adenosyltransferase [Calditrichia bacterium]
MEVARERPAHLHMLFTGRNASQKIMAAADLVTEMQEIKHPYQQGIKAQPGVDY